MFMNQENLQATKTIKQRSRSKKQLKNLITIKNKKLWTSKTKKSKQKASIDQHVYQDGQEIEFWIFETRGHRWVLCFNFPHLKMHKTRG